MILPLDALKEMQLSKAQVSVKRLAAKLGIIKEHESPQLDFTINFSGNNVDISASHQAKVKMPDKMYKFGEMLTCFDDVVKNAKLLEVHSEEEYHNRKPEHKINKSIDKTYVMFSAFNDSEGIVPVKLSVFKMKDNNVNPIHMAITLPTIKKAEVSEVDYQSNDPHISLSAFDYNVSDLLREINENIPMSEKQLESAILRSENGILLNTKMDSGGKRIDLAIKSDDGIIVLGDIYSEIKGLLTFKHAMRFSEEGFRQKYRNKGSDIVIQRLRTLEGDTFNLPDNNSVPKSNISSFETDSNSLHSLSVDNEGNALSECQKEYFKNAKTVDENGKGKADKKYIYDTTGTRIKKMQPNTPSVI